MPSVGVDIQNMNLSGDISGTLLGEALKAGGHSGLGVLSGIPTLARCVATREGSSQDYETTTMLPVAYDTTQVTSVANRSNPQPGDACHPLAAAAHPPLLAFHHNAQVDQMRFDPHTSSLTCSQQAAVAFEPRYYTRDNKTGGAPGGTVNLSATNAQRAGDAAPHVATATQVRRLTPEECEALQGFPRHHTLIPYRGKPAADGPRYKALGNSWAVPVVRWIGARIAVELYGCGASLRPST